MNQSRWPLWVLGFAVVVFVVGFTWLAHARYRTLFSHDWRDESVNNQLLYNTAHGRPLRSTVKGDMIFHKHFRPIFLPLSLPYLVHAGPTAFYFAMALLLGLAALAAFNLGRDLFGDDRLALLSAAFWLLFPPVHELALGIIDPETAAAAFWLFAFVAFRRRLMRSFWLFALLAVVCKETHAPILAAFGVIALIERRRWPWVVWPIVVGSLWFVVAVKWIIPLYHPGFAAVYNRFIAVDTVDFWGEFVAGWQADPMAMLAAMFSREHLYLFVMLLAAGGGLALLSPVTLLAAGPIALEIMLHREPLPVRQAHILAGLAPFVFAATLLGVARLSTWLRKLRPEWKKTPLPAALLSLLIILVLVLAWLPGPFGRGRTYGAENYRPDSLFAASNFTPDPIAIDGWCLIERIPPDATVMTNERYLLALSARREIYEFGNQGDDLEAYLNAQWILFGLTEPPCVTCVYARLTSDTLHIAAELIRNELFVVEDRAPQAILLRRATIEGEQLPPAQVEQVLAQLDALAAQQKSWEELGEGN